MASVFVQGYKGGEKFLDRNYYKSSILQQNKYDIEVNEFAMGR